MFNKLPKEKRDRIIQISAGTVVIVGLLWYFVINKQQNRLKEIADNTEKVQDKLRKEEVQIKGAQKRGPEMEPLARVLAAIEKDMAPANRREWIISIVDDFSRRYNVEYQKFVSENALEWEPLPRFPYKTVNLKITFKAYYHDFGKFLSAFENQYPYIDAMNLVVDSAVPEEERRAQASAEQEKLQFTVDFVALVKPANAL